MGARCSARRSPRRWPCAPPAAQECRCRPPPGCWSSRPACPGRRRSGPPLRPLQRALAAAAALRHASALRSSGWTERARTSLLLGQREVRRRLLGGGARAEGGDAGRATHPERALAGLRCARGQPREGTATRAPCFCVQRAPRLCQTRPASWLCAVGVEGEREGEIEPSERERARPQKELLRFCLNDKFTKRWAHARLVALALMRSVVATARDGSCWACARQHQLH